MNLSSWLRISIIVSLVFHLLALSIIFFIPKKETEKENPIMARLVTPDEMKGVTGEMKKKERASPYYPERSESRRARRPEIREEKRTVEKGPGGTEQEQEKRGGSEHPSRPFPSQQPPGTPSPSPTPPGRGRVIEPPKPSSPLPRERLFDREVIERLTKKEKEEANQDKGITFDTKELRYYTYMRRLKERIEGIWRYPPEAAEKGIYGDLYIRFTIKKDGRLSNIELLRTSGYRDLDEAAMKALKDAEPFWPLPEEWGKEDLVITGHFIYSLYGVYIR